MQKRIRNLHQRPRLPMNFATKLLEKEQELERDCSLQTIEKLVQLYTEAIEYFEYTNDGKCKDFQERMHQILTRTDVLEAVKLQTQSSPNKSISMQQRKIESSEMSSQMVANVNEKVQIQSIKNLNRVIEYQALRNLEVSKKAVLDFKMQDSDLEKRLNSRKKSMLTKSMEISRLLDSSVVREVKENTDLDTVYEENDFFTAENIEKDMDEELEKIMQESFDIKAKKLAEIQVCYESQIKECEGEGALMSQIKLKILEDMKLELETVSAEIDQLRKEAIFELKSRNLNK